MLVPLNRTPGYHKNMNSSGSPHPMGEYILPGSEIPGTLGALQGLAVLHNQCHPAFVREKGRFLAMHTLPAPEWEMGHVAGWTCPTWD